MKPADLAALEARAIENGRSLMEQFLVEKGVAPDAAARVNDRVNERLSVIRPTRGA